MVLVNIDVREDLRELLQKHFPHGFVLVGICKNNTMDIEIVNEENLHGLHDIHQLATELAHEHPEEWVPN